ncbi:MAG TPA: isoprenylcysteine carboxylmethyltransferase family protein [Bacteroidota bacterium]|nr:isoprenylcysteine carboxylmethyltransferase family protein [Bacteroidota bacterium]
MNEEDKDSLRKSGCIAMNISLKVPPPIVTIAIGAMMWCAAKIFPGLTFPIPFSGTIAGITALAGGAMSVLAMITFYKYKTTINSVNVDSTSSFVSSGVYAISRNPIYFGLLLVLIAWCFHISNIVALFGVPLYIIYTNRFQIKPEEEAMEIKFGQAYIAYKEKTRRWI